MTIFPTRYYAIITNSVWFSHGGRLMEWLTINIGEDQFKITFAKNKDGKLIEGKPVTVYFCKVEDEVLFKLTMDNDNIIHVLESYVKDAANSAYD